MTTQDKIEMDKSKWIYFEQQEKQIDKKTDIWIVWTKDGRTPLGNIKWFGRWRCYSFFSNTDVVFEEDCLRDIATFIEKRTKEYRLIMKNNLSIKV